MSLADQWHSLILKNSVNMMRFDAYLRDEVLTLLEDLGNELVKELAVSGLDTPRSDWQRARLRDLLDHAQTLTNMSFEKITSQQATALAQAVDASSTSLVVAMNDAAGVELLQGVQWTSNLLKELVGDTLINGAPSADWWGRQAVDLQQAFSDQMRMGMLKGDSLGSMAARVKSLMETTTRNAEALVRTSTMAVNNAAHLATWRENADSLQKLQWVATLDPRTCIVCGAEDGQQWPVDEDHAEPPLHWNCRCVVIPIPQLWEKLGIKPPESTRASVNGPVSSDTTWESWLEGLPKGEQESILGPARFRLWSSGKLSIRDLTDQRGNALTLAELRKL